jgi:hypothetical protein
VVDHHSREAAVGRPNVRTTAGTPSVGPRSPSPTPPVAGPLATPVAGMMAVAGDLAARAHGEAATVARWFVAAGGARTPAEATALEAAFGDLPAADVVRPGLALTAAEATLPTLLRRGAEAAAWRYYLAVMELAHATVALGLYPGAASLVLLDRLRATLLSAIDAAGARPGVPVGRGDDVLPPVADPGDRGTSDAPGVEGLLGALDGLIGLDPVKSEVRQVADRLLVDQLRRKAGLAVPDTSRHLIFTGNPGTGKTTVARLIGRIYAAMGVVSRGHLIETGRAGLVAGFVGQTAVRVTERFDEADGGVLLVDEAYSLARGSERDFGREAIDAVVKLSEDRRDRVVVILAGYPDEMDTLLAVNPGMSSRFPKVIHFPDYTADELWSIADSLATEAGYRWTPAARTALRGHLENSERRRGFGNGRLARNLVEAAIDRQASRVAGLVRDGEQPDLRTLSQLRKADVTVATGAGEGDSTRRNDRGANHSSSADERPTAAVTSRGAPT